MTRKQAIWLKWCNRKNTMEIARDLGIREWTVDRVVMEFLDALYDQKTERAKMLELEREDLERKQRLWREGFQCSTIKPLKT